MTRKYRIAFYFTFATCVILPSTVFANSSWRWLTDDPLTILPLAVIFTLLVEIFAIYLCNKTTKLKLWRVGLVVTGANLASFLLPYLFLGFEAHHLTYTSNIFEAIQYMMEKGPYYIVGFVFLFLTLVIEGPVVYFALKNSIKNEKKLIISIVVVNCITTLAVAIVEHVICRGQW